jgi:hypothetical protein
MAWDKDKPVGSDPIRDGDDDIRDNWAALETALGQEHKFDATTQACHHESGSAVAFVQDAEPSTRLDGQHFDSEDLGRLWVDTNSSPDNQFKILTAADGAGSNTWTPVSTEIIAVAVAAVHTWAATQTFAVAPAFTKGIVANNSNLQGRNNADDGNVNIVKVNTSDELVFGAISQLPDTSKLASSAAPGADAQIANKKYVDDLMIVPAKVTNVFGSWASKSNNTSYLAATDGIVVAMRTSINGAVVGLTDASDPPTTQRANTQTGSSYVNRTITFPVRKGDYWKVTGANTVFWLPIGA